MSVTIIDKDFGYKRIVREVKNAKKSYVEIGYQGEEKEKNTDIRVVDVAVFNEFGTERIPERSFIRTAFDRVQSKINSTITKMYSDVLLGKLTIGKALSSIGLYMKSEIQKQIDLTVSPPNALSTIMQKRGSTHPLIDTGQMKQSVSYTTHIMGENKLYK